MQTGRTVTRRRVVSEVDTAQSVGSGTVPVLGTPMLLAWWEELTLVALEHEPGTTSVGVHVELDHLAPSPLGAEVTLTARVEGVDDRRVTLAVTADHGEGEAAVLVARGTVVRAVVDVERFLALAGPAG